MSGVRIDCSSCPLFLRGYSNPISSPAEAGFCICINLSSPPPACFKILLLKFFGGFSFPLSPGFFIYAVFQPKLLLSLSVGTALPLLPSSIHSPFIYVTAVVLVCVCVCMHMHVHRHVCIHICMSVCASLHVCVPVYPVVNDLPQFSLPSVTL